jgi:hypothetical protein
MELSLHLPAGTRLRLAAFLGFLCWFGAPPDGWAVAPGNDTCAGAVVVDPLPYLSPLVDVTDATKAGDPPLPPPSTFFDTNVNRSVWYRFVPGESGLYTFSVGADTATTVMDTSMVLYRSTSGCSGVSTIYAFNEDSGLLQSAITTNLVAGEDYYVVVWVGPIETATNNLHVQLRVTHPAPPANDSCAGAELIPETLPSTGYVTGVADTTLAVDTLALPPSCAPSSVDRVPSRDVWYRFRPASSGTYIFSTKMNETQTTVDDTLIAIYTSANECAGPMTEVSGGCNDNDVSRAAFGLSLAGGTQYYIVVWDNSPEVIPGESFIQLRITPAAAPTITTLPPISIASTGAVLSGTINANGLRSSFWFEWGPTAGLGSTSRVRFVFGSSATITTNLSVQPPAPQTLQPNAPYFYRFVAVNDSGMTRGEERQFVWSNTSPHLDRPVLPGNGDLQISFTGNPAQLYLLQSATNLASASPWSNVGLATNTSGSAFQYMHRRGALDRTRLYRLELP